MSSNDMYVKFVYDDSVLNSRLDDTDDKLKEHDELIKELLKRLENSATNNQLELMQNTLTQEFDNKLNEMNNKFQNLLNQFNSTVEQVQNLSDKLDSKFNELTEYVDNKTQQNYDNIMIAVSRDHSRLETAEERVAECEDKVNSQKKKLGECQSSIQHITSSIAYLNNSNIFVDKNLQENLKEPISWVKNNFKKVFEEIMKLKLMISSSATTKPGLNDTLSSILQQQSSSSNRIQSSSQKPSILSPLVQRPGLNLNSQSSAQKQPPSQSQTIDQILGSGLNNNETSSRNQPKDDVQEKPEIEPKKDLKPQKDDSVEEDVPPKPPKEEPKISPVQSQTSINTDNNDNNSQNTTVSTPSIVTPRKTTNTYSNQQTQTPQPKTQPQTQPQQPKQQQTPNPRDFIPYDLTKVRPYSDIQVLWQDRPRLPEIRPFMKIEEVVDHIYKVQPFIQAYLSAMHDKLVESSGQIQQKVDKNLVEKMFERMQSIVADINLALNKLESEVQQTATRKEINGFLEELSKTTRTDAQTAVGRVRCIACGREMAQITGAMTDAEAERAFGPNTPNSLIRGISNHKPGMAYSSIDGFDSAIVEEPRSKRPPQTSLPQSQSQQPSNKTKAKFQ